MKEIIPIERVESRIYLIRGQKVLLDYDLANLYGVETKYLKRQVKRNMARFPRDFMFRLTKEENLRCQKVTSSYGGRRYLPWAFTEQGVAMLSSVLKSERAIQVNILIMRAFVRFRSFLVTHKELARKLHVLEEKFGKHLEKHDEEIEAIFEAMRRMLTVEEKPKKRIGFISG